MLFQIDGESGGLFLFLGCVMCLFEWIVNLLCSTTPVNPAKSMRFSISLTLAGCLTRGSYLTVHFKNAHEVGAAIKGMPLVKAEKYLNDVIAHKNVIAFRRYNGSIGRHAQGHLVKAPGNLCRWPESACKFFLVLLNNLKANGEAKGLNVKDLVINHVQVNHAPVMRRRTYRAHGRIGRSCGWVV